MRIRNRATAALALALAASALALPAAPAAQAATTCDANVWTAKYYANTTFKGDPKKTACDKSINEDYGTGDPAGVTLPKDNFGVRWTVTRNFGSGGPFSFTTAVRDGIRVYLDGTRKINLWKDVTTTQKKTVNVTVPKGKHTLRVDFAAFKGKANVKFAYTPRTSASVDKTKPLVPTGAAVTYTESSGKAEVSWSKNREMDLAGYKVYRRLKGSSTWTKLKTTTATSYTDTPPTTGKTYYYEVRAHDKAGNQSAGTADLGGVTTEDLTPPAAVTGLTAEATEYGIVLAWDANSEDDLHRYVVYRGGLLGDEGEQVCSAGAYEYLSADTTRYVDERQPDGDEACYFIDAVDTSWNSSFQWTAAANAVAVTELDLTPSVETPSGSPVTLTATAADSGTAVELDWSKVTNAVGYHVYRWNPDTSAYERLTTDALTATAWTDTTATTGTTHYYWVTAVYADGAESAPGDDYAILAPA